MQPKFTISVPEAEVLELTSKRRICSHCGGGYSIQHVRGIIMSVSASRDAPYYETNLSFRNHRNFLGKSTKLLLTYRFLKQFLLEETTQQEKDRG